MKKKNLTSFKLNKKSISNLKSPIEVIGGGKTIHKCSHLLTCPLGMCADPGNN
ncbi:hypothetical protein IMCC3317_14250 [Kordia antarctica]|uniref:Uncharacterized protein n=1 Tax=Kordia antarctica TaxID=1218801 RepID=A0A7L4ZHG2_9FLAO|nr:hypothetical protein IMCC3317_14250 [Kordia antarctica]